MRITTPPTLEPARLIQDFLLALFIKTGGQHRLRQGFFYLLRGYSYAALPRQPFDGVLNEEVMRPTQIALQ